MVTASVEFIDELNKICVVVELCGVSEVVDGAVSVESVVDNIEGKFVGYVDRAGTLVSDDIKEVGCSVGVGVGPGLFGGDMPEPIADLFTVIAKIVKLYGGPPYVIYKSIL